MNILLALAFLFFIGATCGWIFEFFFRNLISHKGPHNSLFINPGFCKGPYLPIYGVGLCTMFIISYYTNEYMPNLSKPLIIICIGIVMTIIEFISGIFMLRVMNLRLWDYRNLPFNVCGVICPLFSLIWTLIAGVYYLLIHPYIIVSLIWLSNNLAFSFFIGLFFGFFILDLVLSVKDAINIKKFGDENKVIIKLEEFKVHLIKMRNDAKLKINFFNQLKIDNLNIKDLLAKFEQVTEDKIDTFKHKHSKQK